jgi:thiamine kinase-like enzyme
MKYFHIYHYYEIFSKIIIKIFYCILLILFRNNPSYLKIKMTSIKLVKEYLETKHDFPVKAKLIDVRILSGGLANHVYRLLFDDNSSLVLKHYPEFIVSQNLRMSQKRYFVEKEALRLLSTNIELINHSMIRVPKLVYSDDNAFILIMQYCGDTAIPLFQFLKLNNNLTSHESQKRDEMINTIAHELFKLSDFLSNKSEIRHETHDIPFLNEPALHVLTNFYPSLHRSQAKLFELEKEILPLIHEIENEEDDRKKHPENDVFVFGDLWPNSILIDQDKKLIWVIDWEMARFETRLRDLDQLMCNFWIMKQNPKLFDTEVIEKIMKRLQFVFFNDEKIDWRVKCGKSRFILWIISLIKEKHWEIDDNKEIVLRALNEIENISS